MDENIHNAILSIRDSLIEIRDLLRLEKSARETAMEEAGTAKEVLGKMMESLPPTFRSVIEPLARRG